MAPRLGVDDASLEGSHQRDGLHHRSRQRRRVEHVADAPRGVHAGSTGRGRTRRRLEGARLCGGWAFDQVTQSEKVRSEKLEAASRKHERHERKARAACRALRFVLFTSLLTFRLRPTGPLAPGYEPRLAVWPAPARDRLVPFGVVVVGELFAGLDAAGGADPDRLVHDLHPAVRPARVIDEPRHVAVDVGVAAPVAVHPEHPDAARSAGSDPRGCRSACSR